MTNEKYKPNNKSIDCSRLQCLVLAARWFQNETKMADKVLLKLHSQRSEAYAPYASEVWRMHHTLQATETRLSGLGV